MSQVRVEMSPGWMWRHVGAHSSGWPQTQQCLSEILRKSLPVSHCDSSSPLHGRRDTKWRDVCLRMLMEGSSTPTLPQPRSVFTQPVSSRKSPIKTNDRTFWAGSGTQPGVALNSEIGRNREMDIIPGLTRFSRDKSKHERVPSPLTG